MNGKKKGKKEDKDLSLSGQIKIDIDKGKNLTKKELKDTIKKEEKAVKKALNKFVSSQDYKDRLKWQQLDRNLEKLKTVESGKINIKYGSAEFNIKKEWFERIKDKEHYLNYLYSKNIENKIAKLPKISTEGEAKEVNALIEQYTKKLYNTEYFNDNFYKNVIGKLNKYSKGLNLFRTEDIKQQLIEQDEAEESGEELDEPIKLYDAISNAVYQDGILIGLNVVFF